MARLHPQLRSIRAIAFDLDGTLYQQDRAIDGAVETVRALGAMGVPLRFLTNTTSQSRATIAAKLLGMGFPVDEADILTPAAAASAFLRAAGESAHLLVRRDGHADFAGVEIDDEDPDWVVVGDLETAWTFGKLNRAFQLLQEGGARLIGLGRTRFWQAETGLQLDAGPFVAALEYATGQRARVFGKPDPAFFEAAIAGLPCQPREVAVCGDDVETDVRAAMAAGLYGVLVKTGKFRAADLAEGPAPDLVLGSAADLVDRTVPPGSS